jgi:hypothetical protein
LHPVIQVTFTSWQGTGAGFAGRFCSATRHKGDPMKKWPKKLKLAKETLLFLESENLEKAFGGFPVKTVDATYCASNCLHC